MLFFSKSTGLVWVSRFTRYVFFPARSLKPYPLLPNSTSPRRSCILIKFLVLSTCKYQTCCGVWTSGTKWTASGTNGHPFRADQEDSSRMPRMKGLFLQTPMFSAPTQCIASCEFPMVVVALIKCVAIYRLHPVQDHTHHILRKCSFGSWGIRLIRLQHSCHTETILGTSLNCLREATWLPQVTNRVTQSLLHLNGSCFLHAQPRRMGAPNTWSTPGSLRKSQVHGSPGQREQPRQQGGNGRSATAWPSQRHHHRGEATTRPPSARSSVAPEGWATRRCRTPTVARRRDTHRASTTWSNHSNAVGRWRCCVGRVGTWCCRMPSYPPR